MISGTLGVTVGFEEYVLEPGDSISFESSIPHRLHNDGDDAVHAIWVVLGPLPRRTGRETSTTVFSLP